ncbi:MAG: hypothetical protein WBZ24_09505 [Anaerolineales bacterium]|jgi:hypothetical protein
MARRPSSGRKSRKRSARPNLSQIIFSLIALIVIASFVLSLIAK